MDYENIKEGFKKQYPNLAFNRQKLLELIKKQNRTIFFLRKQIKKIERVRDFLLVYLVKG